MSVDELDIVWRLGLALALSAAIGLERELSQKSAGLRTYTLVGLGSALFMSSWAKVHGPGPVAELGEIDGVLDVAAGDVNEMFE